MQACVRFVVVSDSKVEQAEEQQEQAREKKKRRGKKKKKETHHKKMQDAVFFTVIYVRGARKSVRMEFGSSFAMPLSRVFLWRWRCGGASKR